MTSTDVIPELNNAAHNPRFWCLPPVHDESSEAGTGNFPMYLVTQGGSVGVWHNWTVVKAMRGHHTMQGCVAEWQQHYVLGVHPHPPEPKHAETTIRPIPGPQRNHGHVVEPALQMDLVVAGRAEPPERQYTVSVTREYICVKHLEYQHHVEGDQFVLISCGVRPANIILPHSGEAKEAFLKAEAWAGIYWVDDD
ncbi:hypothetical protein DFH08DRAFT_800051 [Mycena albidolilacea]|uniref:Uncharacterized protein n=1 Tax=Mycena albidolilacea TaxID=1033008 RepID=A0AAD7AML3_9AGAR|nr:hypothetical protein DFH08DRAFT_800051 [Mycena albidolilacea]